MGFIEEHFLLCLLSLAAIATFFWLLQFRERLRIGFAAALVVSLIHVAFGVFCVKAFAFLESGADPEGFSSFSIFGAVFFMPLGYFLGAKLTKRKPADVFDIFAICMLFTLACSRVNCLHNGCCAGISFFGTAWHWPTREIEIAYYLLFILLLAPHILKNQTSGEVYPLYMISYGALRFLLEFVRMSSSNYLLHLSHLWAVISLLVGLTIFFEQRVRARKKQRNPKKTPKSVRR